MTERVSATTLWDMDLDYCNGDYLQDILERDLLELGGRTLLNSAHDEAGNYVDEQYRWDGRGDEPAERVSAYCAVLWQVAERVRAEAVA